MTKFNHMRGGKLSFLMRLNKDGQLYKPEVMYSDCDIEVDVAIGEMLESAPAWDVAIKDKHPIEATVVLFLKVYFDADKKPHVTFKTSNQDDNIWLFSNAFCNRYAGYACLPSPDH